jgi:hypothetical protein
MTPKRVVLLLAVVSLLIALWRGAGGGHQPQGPDDVPSEVASVWFDQLYDLVKTERITAPPCLPDLWPGGRHPLRGDGARQPGAPITRGPAERARRGAPAHP